MANPWKFKDKDFGHGITIKVYQSPSYAFADLTCPEFTTSNPQYVSNFLEAFTKALDYMKEVNAYRPHVYQKDDGSCLKGSCDCKPGKCGDQDQAGT